MPVVAHNTEMAFHIRGLMVRRLLRFSATFWAARMNTNHASFFCWSFTSEFCISEIGRVTKAKNTNPNA